MSTEDVTARVEQFIADFHAAWERSGRVSIPAFNPFEAEPDTSFDPFAWMSTPADFAAWERELGTLVDAHFTAGATTGEEGHLSGRSPHDPGSERILGVEVRRTRADVRTYSPDAGGGEDHYVYRMVSTDDGWRIGKIVRTSAPPDGRLMAADAVHRLLLAMGAEEAEPVADDLARGVAGLFTDRHALTELGTITTSGVLTVHDFGWVQHDLAPLRRRVPAGTHPVEVARDDDSTNLAVRVRFSDEPTVRWVPATRVGFDNVVLVDASNVAVVDFLTLTACTALEVEESYQERAVAGGGADAVFSLGGRETDAVLVRSGHGDGAYPAYWGLAADGSVTDLAVDFLVAVEPITTTATTPWRIGPAELPELAAHGFEVVSDGDGTLFRYREQAGSSAVGAIRVLGPDGRAVPGREGGVFVQGGVSERGWSPDAPVPDGAVVEVSLHLGYRHA